MHQILLVTLVHPETLRERRKGRFHLVFLALSSLGVRGRACSTRTVGAVAAAAAVSLRFAGSSPLFFSFPLVSVNKQTSKKMRIAMK